MTPAIPKPFELWNDVLCYVLEGELQRWQCPECKWWRDSSETCQCGRTAPEGRA